MVRIMRSTCCCILGVIGLLGSRFTRWMSNIRVVFSIDLIMTRVLGVRGEFASLRGLKLRRALMTRFEVPGRVLTRIDMQFNVASTSRASLQFRVELVTWAFTVKSDPLTCSPAELPTFGPGVRTLQP